MTTTGLPGSSARHASGYDQLFRNMVKEYSPRLLSCLYAVTNCAQTAEDILQDSYLKLWLKREQITYDKPDGWLYRVAMRTAYKYINSETRKAKKLQDLERSFGFAICEEQNQLIYKQQIQQLESAYSRLPLMQKKVFQLSSEAGLKRDEIAGVLNISSNTVKVHLGRARNFIRSQIAILLVPFVFNIIYCSAGNTATGQQALYTSEESNPIHLLDVQINDADKNEKDLFLKFMRRH